MHSEHQFQATGGMFGNTSGALGFGQQQPVGGMNLGASFGQQPLQGTGNPPFELTKVDH